MTRLTVALLLAIAAAGCDETTGPSDPRQFDRRAFVDARSRWRAAGLSDYTAEIRHSCFCPAHLNFWTRVTVRNDKVASDLAATIGMANRFPAV